MISFQLKGPNIGPVNSPVVATYLPIYLPLLITFSFLSHCLSISVCLCVSLCVYVHACGGQRSALESSSISFHFIFLAGSFSDLVDWMAKDPEGILLPLLPTMLGLQIQTATRQTFFLLFI